MPGATPIYGFPYPDPSDLVANYPALGQQLAEDVEDEIAAIPLAGISMVAPTSLANSGGSASATGGAVTFTSVTSLSLNGIFTATYANYFFIVTYSASAATSISLRLRATTDNTTSNYNSQRILGNGATVSGGGITSATAWEQVAYTGADTNNSFQFAVTKPQIAENTTFLGDGISTNTTISNLKTAGFFNAATQFDGITIFPVSGNITGVIRAYGYKNS
jgi:hypothetical protein